MTAVAVQAAVRLSGADDDGIARIVIGQNPQQVFITHAVHLRHIARREQSLDADPQPLLAGLERQRLDGGVINRGHQAGLQHDHPLHGERRGDVRLVHVNLFL